MLESIDEGAGQIMAKLEELKLAENTLLIFTSDNGGERSVTDNFPLRAGKSHLYEGGLREPCIVRWPARIKPRQVCDEPIITQDFYPTFMEVASLKPDGKQPIDGKSLLPLLEGATTLNRDALYWHYPMAKPHFLGASPSVLGGLADGGYGGLHRRPRRGNTRTRCAAKASADLSQQPPGATDPDAIAFALERGRVNVLHQHLS